MQEEKIWGTTEQVIATRTITINILRVKKGGVCSWHYHDRKYNHFYLISGSFIIRTIMLPLLLDCPGMSYVIGPESLHEFEAQEDSVVIETCYVHEGEINSNDIHRLRLGYYKQPDGLIFCAPDDGTVEQPFAGLPNTSENRQRIKRVIEQRMLDYYKAFVEQMLSEAYAAMRGEVNESDNQGSELLR